MKTPLASKSASVQQVIEQMLHILETVGISRQSLTQRRQERMAMAVLALADVKSSDDWKNARCLADNYSLKTRAIIQFWNTHFEEQVSSGSYDDVRRRDLVEPKRLGIVLPSKQTADTNDGTRGYGITVEFRDLLHSFGTPQWEQHLAEFHEKMDDQRKNFLTKQPRIHTNVTLPNGQQIIFGGGEHNRLQKAIIEEFLPRWGNDATVLYVGDATDKALVLAKDKMEELNLFLPERGKLPDVIAYSLETNRLFLIEAVYSSGTISNERRSELQAITRDSSVEVIYVTAFLNWQTFRRFSTTIGWETEVWIADEPNHLIHFDGERFL